MKSPAYFHDYQLSFKPIVSVTRGVLPGLRCEHLRCPECDGAAWCCCCSHFAEVKAGIQRALEALKHAD